MSATTLALVTWEGIVYTNTNTSLTISSTITGTTATGMTYSGSGTVTLAGVNAVTGGNATALLGGTLVIANPLALGGTTPLTGAPNLTWINGTLQTSLTNGVLLTNPLTFNNSTVTLAGSNTLLFGNGAPTLTAGTTNFFNDINTAVTDFNQAFAGTTGVFVKLGADTLIMSANNGWTGGTYVNTGTLQTQNSNGPPLSAPAPSTSTAAPTSRPWAAA